MSSMYATAPHSSPTVIKSDHLLDIKKLPHLNMVVINGWSVAPDVKHVYDDLLAYIDHHLLRYSELRIYFKYELFNTSTAACIIRIIKKLNMYHSANKKVHVYWLFGETTPEMLDAGIDFREFSLFRFQIEQW